MITRLEQIVGSNYRIKVTAELLPGLQHQAGLWAQGPNKAYSSMTLQPPRVLRRPMFIWVMYRYGLGTEYHSAITWYTASARDGDSWGMFSGLVYEEGSPPGLKRQQTGFEGLPKRTIRCWYDGRTAGTWWRCRQAWLRQLMDMVQMTVAPAQNRLAVAYEYGEALLEIRLKP